MSLMTNAWTACGAATVILYVFVVAVLNLSLGAGVAVYLGRRYRALVADDPWAGDGFGQLAEVAENAQASVVPDIAADSPPDEPAQPESPPQAEQEKVDWSAVESPVRDLKAGVEQYHEQLARVIKELRACSETGRSVSD